MSSLLQISKTVKRFDGAKVRVYVRRWITDPLYDLSSIVPDVCWVARYALNVVVNFDSFTDRVNRAEEFLSIGVNSIFKALPKYPVKDFLGPSQTFNWFTRVASNAYISALRKDSTRTDSIRIELDDPNYCDGDSEELTVSKTEPLFYLADIESHLGKKWSHNDHYTHLVEKLLKDTVSTGEQQKVTNYRVMNVYRAVLAAVIGPEQIPTHDELEGDFAVYSILVGEDNARKLQWLYDLMHRSNSGNTRGRKRKRRYG